MTEELYKHIHKSIKMKENLMDNELSSLARPDHFCL